MNRRRRDARVWRSYQNRPFDVPDETRVRVKAADSEKAVLEGADRLEGFLRRNEFEIRGQVYLNPLTPFQPQPEMPSGPQEAREHLMAFESIGPEGEQGFTYPDDAGGPMG